MSYRRFDHVYGLHGGLQESAGEYFSLPSSSSMSDANTTVLIGMRGMSTPGTDAAMESKVGWSAGVLLSIRDPLIKKCGKDISDGQSRSGEWSEKYKKQKAKSCTAGDIGVPHNRKK